MKKTRLLKFALVLLLVAVVIAMMLQIWARGKVEQALDSDLPSSVNLRYSKLELNIFTQRFCLKDLELTYSHDSSHLIAEISAEAITIKKLRYFQWLVNDTIILKKAEISSPVVRYYPHAKTPERDSTSADSIRHVSVELLRVTKGSFYMFKDARDSFIMEAHNINMEIAHACTRQLESEEELPFENNTYSLSCDSVRAHVKPYRLIYVDKIDLHDSTLTMNKISLRTRLSKEKFSAMIPSERDYISLYIPEATFDKVNLSKVEQKFQFSSDLGTVESPRMEVYRDKRVADDDRVKPLYSKELRDLPIWLDVKELKMKDAYISYEEEIMKVTSPGKIFFDQTFVHMVNLSNTSNSPGKTEIKAISKIMGQAHAELHYIFNVDHLDDRFTTTGAVKGLHMPSINSFLQANMDARLVGTIDRLEFELDGNAKIAQGDIRMKYRDFKIHFLKKNSKEVNKLKTTLSGIFINDGSKTEQDGYRYGEFSVPRDESRSYFNYVWQNLKEGMITTVTGSGKKKNDKSG